MKMLKIYKNPYIYCGVLSVIALYFYMSSKPNDRFNVNRNINQVPKKDNEINIAHSKLEMGPGFDLNLKPDDCLNRLRNQSYGAFEEILCNTKLKPNTPLERLECPKGGIVTVQKRGRLGNNIWEYAAVWAVAKATGLKPFVPRCIVEKLIQVFEFLTVPTLEQIMHCPFKSNSFVNIVDNWKFTNQSLLLPLYSQSTRTIVPYIKDLRQEFRISEKLKENSYRVLKTASKLVTEEPVFVGIHVRRGGYFIYLKKAFNFNSFVSRDFYLSAMKYFEQKYKFVVFVVMTDDTWWCSNNLWQKTNVFIASKITKSLEEDFAIMASCNHSIIDYGTFGLWGALLAGGETIFYKSEPILITMEGLLPNWYGLA